MKYVVIVNGKPGSGKTTFQTMCKDILNESEIAYCHIVSSIDYIKELYYKLGWNGEKTDKARKDLSILKKMWIDNCEGPTKHIIKFLNRLDDESDHVVFVDIREESEIIKITEVLEALRSIDIRYATIFIDRPDMDGLEYGNTSDDDAGKNMSLYKYHIINDNDLDTLYNIAAEILLCDIMSM